MTAEQAPGTDAWLDALLTGALSPTDAELRSGLMAILDDEVAETPPSDDPAVAEASFQAIMRRVRAEAPAGRDRGRAHPASAAARVSGRRPRQASPGVRWLLGPLVAATAAVILVVSWGPTERPDPLSGMTPKGLGPVAAPVVEGLDVARRTGPGQFAPVGPGQVLSPDDVLIFDVSVSRTAEVALYEEADGRCTALTPLSGREVARVRAGTERLRVNGRPYAYRLGASLGDRTFWAIPAEAVRRAGVEAPCGLVGPGASAAAAAVTVRVGAAGASGP